MVEICSWKKTHFLEWIGLKKIHIHNKRQFNIIFITVVVLFSSMSFIVIPFFEKSSELATSQFSGQGIKGIVFALIYAFLQTGLSEEIFFRGFLGKCFINKFGFVLGNILQAGLFGLIHGILLVNAIGTIKAVFLIIFTGTIGWMMGYINERQSNGSIVPGWIIHGIANTISAFIALFNLIK